MVVNSRPSSGKSTHASRMAAMSVRMFCMPAIFFERVPLSCSSAASRARSFFAQINSCIASA